MRKFVLLPIALCSSVFLTACESGGTSNTKPIAGITEDAFALAPRSEQDAMANVMHYELKSRDRYKQIALMAGQTVSVGSGKNKVSMTCLKGVLSISVAQSANVNVRALAGMYLMGADYHCNAVVGSALLAHVEGSDHIGKLITSGVLQVAGGVLVAKEQNKASSAPQTVINNLSTGGNAAAVLDNDSTATAAATVQTAESCGVACKQGM